MAVTAPCPQCGGPSRLATDNPWRPFCCERCKLVDLGQWLQEEYRIPGPTAHGADGGSPQDQ